MSVTVSGRTYSGFPQMSVAIPSFDAPALQANGWTAITPSPLSGGTGETWAGRLRRLASAAAGNNPIDLPPLRGSIPWAPLGGAWQASTAVIVGQTVSNGGYMYLCVSPGTTAASGGPTGTIRYRNPSTGYAPNITDGTVIWVYYLGSVGDVVSNGGNLYIITTAGVPATSGGGPTGFGSAITDGSITWAYYGPQTAPAVSTPYTTHNASYSNQYTITNTANTLIPNTMSTPFRFDGGAPISSVFGNDFTAVGMDSAPAGGNLFGTLNTNGSIISFDFEGTSFELEYYSGNANPIVMIVDGQYIDYPVITNAGVHGVYYYQKIDFTNIISMAGSSIGNARARHRITLELAGLLFKRLSCLPTDAISAPVLEDDFMMGLIGDSQSVSTHCPCPSDGFPYKIAKLMGIPSVGVCGIGGTGIVGPGGATPYIGHAVEDFTRYNNYRPLGLIVVQISQNDGGFQSTLQGAALTLFQTLRAAFPTVPIWVLGAITGGNEWPPSAGQAAVETLVMNAVAQQQAAGDNLIFVTPLASTPYPSITGSGCDTAPNGTGSADKDVGYDFTHINPYGHSIYARRNVEAFLNLIRNIP
jgi:hypothetical protein